VDRVVEQFAETGAGWVERFREFTTRIGRAVGRQELKTRVVDYLRGLLSSVERKNGWQLAEVTGKTGPHTIQHLLNGARWEADAVRDELRDYVVEHLGEADATLVVDETGFLKKGKHSVGVQRQYSGTAGRIENCQVGVFLAYASQKGHVLLDRALYLPESWAADAERRAAAGIPESVEFATKPVLARQMIARAYEAKVPFQWVTGDEVYGSDHKLRRWLQQADRWYVLAVRGNQYVWGDGGQVTVDGLAARLPRSVWRRLSAGEGSKGPRLYEWVRIKLGRGQAVRQQWLLVRRSLEAPRELAYYLVYAPTETTLQTMARIAGTRWTIEESFEASKGEVGLTDYEVRSWHGWHRHITLAMAAHAYLTVLRAYAIEPPTLPKKADPPMPAWQQKRLSSSP
jgi:SRSO17 transposase